MGFWSSLFVEKKKEEPPKIYIPDRFDVSFSDESPFYFEYTDALFGFAALPRYILYYFDEETMKEPYAIFDAPINDGNFYPCLAAYVPTKISEDFYEMFVKPVENDSYIKEANERYLDNENNHTARYMFEVLMLHNLLHKADNLYEEKKFNEKYLKEE